MTDGRSSLQGLIEEARRDALAHSSEAEKLEGHGAVQSAARERTLAQVHRYFADKIEATLPSAPDDSIGLSIDMLDVDRLRTWAEKLLIHGADISHWASVPHVAGRMQTLATSIEKAIRDIGTLRQLAALSVSDTAEPKEPK